MVGVETVELWIKTSKNVRLGVGHLNLYDEIARACFLPLGEKCARESFVTISSGSRFVTHGPPAPPPPPPRRKVSQSLCKVACLLVTGALVGGDFRSPCR